MTPGLRIACAAVIALAGCVRHDSAACGPDMIYATAAGVCVCDEHAIAGEHGCVPCADDEIVVGTTCSCTTGTARSGTGACEPVHGLDDACDATTPCNDAVYDYCTIRNGVGSCTRRCLVDEDCPDAYTCATWDATPSCRPFTGFGAACVTQDDCANLDANFCIQGYCVVQGCSAELEDCPRGTTCCDFSTYGLGTICAPTGTCS